LLLREDSEKPADREVEFEEGSAQATAEFRPQDVLYLQPDRILQELPASSRVAQDLNALFRISRVVHSIRDLEQLQTQILNLIFEVAPAERGAILLNGRKDAFASVFARHRSTAVKQAVRVSRTITCQVMEKGLAILGTDVQQGRAVSESLAVSGVRSLLCVPMTVFQKVIGCIYLDTTSPSSRFDQHHLHLVATIAGICGVALDNARSLQQLEQENLRLTAEINLQQNMVGESPRMKQVYQFLSLAGPSDATVLLRGESGTGKELAARALHRNGPRARKPFVAINSAAIPEGLVESELFGHEKGSFTGAIAQKKGRLELADGGVVFFDEIGELSPAVQVKLLRVLQEREFERVGGTRPISVNIRLIAATNKNLEAAVEAGHFRRDLYYRLNVMSVTMPPLRERREDIPQLAEYFALKCSERAAVKRKPISPDAMACLVNYDWPGNVRELENAIERALVLGTSDVIELHDLPESILEKGLPPGVATAKYHYAIKELKKQLITKALEEARGSYADAARLLGLHPNYLHRLIRNLDLKDSLRSVAEPLTGSTKGSRSRT
jgi:Nif-specific regulatory protein